MSVVEVDFKTGLGRKNRNTANAGVSPRNLIEALFVYGHNRLQAMN